MKRRQFLRSLAIVPSGAWLPIGLSNQAPSPASPLARFKLGSISDEWTQDFEAALQAMKSYGLSWVELRTLWGIYNTEATAEQLRKIRDLLRKYDFKVSVVDTALYKCALPGTRPAGKEKDAYPYSGQTDLLKRAIERAHALEADKIRIFAFWRVEKPAAHFEPIAQELRKAAEVAKSGGVRLVLENESECNVATGHELAQMLKLVPAENFGANWDVGNGAWQGERSFPEGYRALPKRRIWHLHLKDVRCGPQFKKCDTVVVGQGQVDLDGQTRALVADNYQETMSLEPEVEALGFSHLELTRRSLEALLKLMARAMG